MKIKFTLFVALLVNSASGHALENYGSPFRLQCVGEKGTIEVVQMKSGISYDINIGDTHKKDFVQHRSEGENGDWEQSTATFIDPVYQPSHWLSVIFSEGVKAWHPPHVACRHTRASECDLVEYPGYYFNRVDKWVDLMIDLTTPGQVIFMSLDMDGFNRISDLGSHTQCSIEEI